MKKLLITGFLGLVTLSAANANCIDKDNSWLVRVRGVGVIPAEKSSITPIGGTVKVSDTFVPELDFSYFINDNFAAELILA